MGTDSPEQRERGEFHAIRPSQRDTGWGYQRNLPHISVEGATYFVTFACAREQALDPPARDIVLAAARFWDGPRMDLDVAVVMPDHVHMLLRMHGENHLGVLLHSVKSYSANRVNALLGRSGTLWQQESFDHIIRNIADWEEKANYIRMNPVTRGLVGSPGEWPWLYDAYR